MCVSRITAIYLILVAASASAVKADNIAFMSTNTGVFGTIDLNTGAFTQLGSSAVALGGIAVVNGTLYASSYNTTGSGTLYTVNPANGSLTIVGTSSIITPALAPPPAACTLWGSTGISIRLTRAPARQ